MQKTIERAHPLTPLIRGWLVLVAIAFALLNRLLPELNPSESIDPKLADGSPWSWESEWRWMLVIVGGIIICAVVVGYFSWRFTKFIIDDEEIRVETGILARKSQRIAFGKLQSIDIVQPFAARLFSLAELHIKTAGTESIELRYLGLKRARKLRNYLLNRAAQVKNQLAAPRASIKAQPSIKAQSDAEDQSGVEGWLGVEGQPVVEGWSAVEGQPSIEAQLGVESQLSPCLVSGEVTEAKVARTEEITNGTFQIPTVVQADERLILRVKPQRLIIAAITSHEFIILVIGLLLFAVISIAALGSINIAAGIGLLIALGSASGGFIVRRFISQFGYKLVHRPEGVRITRGLTSITSQSLPIRRIQAAQISQPLIWRKLGFYRVDIEVVGGGELTTNENSTGASTILLPVGTWSEVTEALRTIWPGADPLTVELRSVPKRARWIYPFSAPFLSWGFDDFFVVSRRGWLVRKYQLVPHRRAQSLSVIAGPISSKLDLASIAIHTPGLQISVRAQGIEAEVAATAATELAAYLHDRSHPDVTDASDSDFHRPTASVSARRS